MKYPAANAITARMIAIATAGLLVGVLLFSHDSRLLPCRITAHNSYPAGKCIELRPARVRIDPCFDRFDFFQVFRPQLGQHDLLVSFFTCSSRATSACHASGKRQNAAARECAGLLRISHSLASSQMPPQVPQRSTANLDSVTDLRATHESASAAIRAELRRLRFSFTGRSIGFWAGGGSGRICRSPSHAQ